MYRHDFGCIRETELAKWGRTKESLCWRGKDMKHHNAVSILSKAMENEYDCNLNYVSSIAIKPFMRLKGKTDPQKVLKKRVLETIVKAIKTNQNPFTREHFGEYGLTEMVVQQMIKYHRVGSAIPDIVRHDIKYTQKDVISLMAALHETKSCTLCKKLISTRVITLFNIRRCNGCK